MRSTIRPLLVFVGTCTLVAVAVPCHAQGFGVGVRMSMVRPESVDGVESDSVRFTGGQIRLRTSGKVGIEVALDRRTETFDELNERVRDTPLQASLLLFPVRGAFSPFVLAGPGWYSHTVESLDDESDSESTRKFGWHAGFGAELLMGRHAGLHADYRYTFLKFGDDDEPEAAAAQPRHSFVNSLLPSHNGSMWTAGLTIYF